MFTANSMNCLTEAIGLALPGNGSTLATHAARKALFENAGRTVVDIAKRWYDGDDASVLPRAIATRDAFENAVALDVAMGGSTNTVLHLLAAAREAELDFGVADIDAISRRVPCVAKVAPNTQKYHMEDVHRAGGIPAILGELDRGGLLHRDVHAVHAPSLKEWLSDLGRPRRLTVGRGRRAVPRRAGRRAHDRAVLHHQPLVDAGHRRGRRLHPRRGARLHRRRRAGDPARQPRAGRLRGQDRRRRRGAVAFRGPAKVFESQEAAVDAILAKEIVAGDVVVIRYEGPARRAGHAGDALPDVVPQGPRAGQGRAR